MDDLLGLNEINTNTNSHSNGYFEEEDKKEELYIKMIEDRIMFKIRQEIIVPLISDFNVKSDINMCEILKLKDDVSELKECVDILKQQLTSLENITKDNVTQTDNLSNIISNLKVYSPDVYDISCAYVNKTDMKDITTEEINYHHKYPPTVSTKGIITFKPIILNIKIFYNLKILHLSDVGELLDGKDISNDNLTKIIIKSIGSINFRFLNLKYLPSLNVIIIEQIRGIDSDIFIEQLSSYKHNIQTVIFCGAEHHIHYIEKYKKQWDNLKTYCEENNITSQFNNTI
jgi:hypothetical protein